MVDRYKKVPLWTMRLSIFLVTILTASFGILFTLACAGAMLVTLDFIGDGYLWAFILTMICSWVTCIGFTQALETAIGDINAKLEG